MGLEGARCIKELSVVGDGESVQRQGQGGIWQGFHLVLRALGSRGRVSSRAATIRFVFGEDHCGIHVSNGDKGRCGEIGEEATVMVHAGGNGGWGGNADIKGSDQM